MIAAEFKTSVCAISKLSGRLQAWEHSQLFHLLDRNGDGKLQPDEWARRFDSKVVQAGLQTRALRKLKDVLYHRKLPLQQFLRDCDANRDDSISPAELQQAVLRLVEPGTRPGGAALPAGCVLSKDETRELAGQFAAGSRVDLGALGTSLSALNVSSDEEMLRRVREALLKAAGGSGRGGGAADDAVLRRAFATLDADGGGMVSAAGFRDGLGGMNTGVRAGVHAGARPAALPRRPERRRRSRVPRVCRPAHPPRRPIGRDGA
jgi:Ca2+-binding EF-hand superfamily protein